MVPCLRRLSPPAILGGPEAFEYTVTYVATRFEEFLDDEANDALTTERLFLAAVDNALEQRRQSRAPRLIH
ncbi:hypothetical protein [Arthrobacter rhombi]|uniref:hypothetical protein n=1 Tax=Arthrobacter rhombi TaxID=71253 RepID=UPI003FD11D61